MKLGSVTPAYPLGKSWSELNTPDSGGIRTREAIRPAIRSDNDYATLAGGKKQNRVLLTVLSLSLIALI